MKINGRISNFQEFKDNSINEEVYSLSNILKDITSSSLGDKGDIGSMLSGLSNLFGVSSDISSDIFSSFGDAAKKEDPTIGSFESIPDSDDELRKKNFTIPREVMKKNSEIAGKLMGDVDAIEPDYSKLGSSSKVSLREDLSSFKHSDFIEFLSKNGYKDIDKDKWNIIGIRNKLSVRKSNLNGFVDAFVVISPEKDKEVHIYDGTTFPGIAYRVLPYRAWWLSRGDYKWLASSEAMKGVAIVQPGIYDMVVSNHRGKPCLRQDGNIKIDRYPLVKTASEAKKISSYSPGNEIEGNFGMFIHRAGSNSSTINNWSAGCQVTKRSSDMDSIVSFAKKNGGKIKYILIKR